jgi:hypothetical protein
MCDYSLHNVKTRPAKVGDKLTTRDFGTGTHGFATSEDASVAVCVMPGTELSFADEVMFAVWHARMVKYTTAIFRQINWVQASAATHLCSTSNDGRRRWALPC